MRMADAVRRLTMVAGMLLAAARTDAADRQVRPYLGTTFGGGTTFVDPESAIGEPHLVIGASAVFLGEVFGVEIDVADTPGFFEAGGQLVRQSHVTTVSGNVIVAAPHRLTEYSLRPYFVGGFGVMRVKTTTTFAVFDVAAAVPMVDAGGGVLAFLTNRVGFSGDVRRFQTIGSKTGNTGLSFGEERLSFWRATMAAVIRY